MSKMSTPRSVSSAATVHVPETESVDSINLLVKYYELRIKIELALNHKPSIAALEQLYQREDFRKDCSEVMRQLGIAGFFYGIIDAEPNRVHLVKNQRIDLRQRAHPFFYYPDQTNDKQDLLDLLFEAEEEYFKVFDNNPRRVPYFLPNTPPFSSAHSFPQLALEERMRAGNVNFLYCYTGEVLFCSYIYRYLTKVIKLQGFNQLFPIDQVEITNRRTTPYQLWDLAEWEAAGFQDIPEIRWLRIIAKPEGHPRYAENKVFKRLNRQWKTYINEHEVVQAGEHCLFTSEEWPNLALTPSKHMPTAKGKKKHWNRARASLLSYAVHLALKTPINPNFKLIKFDHLREDYQELMRDTLYSIEHYQAKDWEKTIKLLLKSRKLKAGRDGTVKPLTKEQSRHWIHYFVLLVFYLYFTKDSNSHNHTARYFLQQLHRQSRFPVFQTYFQIAWDQNHHLPVEYYYFPLHNSILHTFKVNSSTVKKSGSTDTTDQLVSVVMAVVQLHPVWRLNDQFNITQDGKTFLFMEDADISPISRMRLNLTQDFLRLMSTPAVDSFFYGQITEEKTRQASKDEQHQFQAHEIKDIIGKINKQSPEYILDLVKLYLNVIFGSRASIVRSFVKMNRGTLVQEELPREFCIDLDTADVTTLIEHSITIACKVQAITEDYSSWKNEREFQSFPSTESEFEERVKRELESRISIVPREHTQHGDLLAQPLREGWFTDLKDARGFYFMMAIVCGLRNAIEHSRPNSPIRLYQTTKDHPYLGSCLVIENVVKDISDKTIRKINLGSTALSLVYYMRTLLSLTNSFYQTHADSFNTMEFRALVLEGPRENPQQKGEYLYYTYIPGLS